MSGIRKICHAVRSVKLFVLAAVMANALIYASPSYAFQTKYRINARLPADKQCSIDSRNATLADAISKAVLPFGFGRLKDVLISGRPWVTFSLGGGFMPAKRVDVIVLERERLVGIVDFQSTTERPFVRQLREAIEASVLEYCGVSSLRWKHVTSWDPS